VPLYDGAEVIGAVVRSRAQVSPLYVSIGHKVDLETAVQYVLSCCRGYRLPETTRQAHLAAGQPAGEEAEEVQGSLFNL
jgi:deoxyribonuclease V